MVFQSKMKSRFEAPEFPHVCFCGRSIHQMSPIIARHSQVFWLKRTPKESAPRPGPFQWGKCTWLIVYSSLKMAACQDSSPRIHVVSLLP